MLHIQQKSVEALLEKELYEGRTGQEILDRFRNCLVVKALNLNSGNITKTAQMLDIHRNTLDTWMKESNIESHYPDNEFGQGNKKRL